MKNIHKYDLKFWFLLAVVAVIILNIVIKISINNKNSKVEIEDYIPKPELTLDDSIRHFIKFINVAHPDIVYAQAVLESGNFTSNNFKKNNNLFGMKVPKQRANMNSGGTKYSKYDKWEYSIVDYALYQATFFTDSNGKIVDRATYLLKLKNSYASDPKYIEKVDKLSELYFKEKEL